MRLRGWWFLILFGAVAALGAVRWLDRTGRALGVRQAEDGTALRSLAFRIPDSGSLELDLPPNAHALRVFAHAELQPGLGPEDAEDPRRFALRFRFEGWSDRTSERTYHFRSRVSRAVGVSGEVRPRSRYLRADALPLDPRVALLSLAGLDFRPQRVYVSVADLDPGLAGASIRLYFQEAVAESRRHAQWPRLSVADRVRRAAGNLYPHYLLSGLERQALVRRRWSPLAPSGVAGTDYERRIVLWSEVVETLEEESAGAGWTLPAGVLAVVHTGDGQPLRVAVSPREGDPSDVQASFVGEDGAEAPVGRDVRAEAIELSTGGDPGWMTLHAPRPFSVHSLAADSPDPLDVESIQAFRCSEHGVRYRVVHLPGRPTPVRIDFRSEAGAEAVDATYRLLSADEVALGEGRLVVGTEISRFDWLDVEGDPRRVTEATQSYIVVPLDAERIEVSCRVGGLVALYNQAPDFVLEQRLPRPTEEPVRRWSPVMPIDRSQLIEAGQSTRLRLQRRPPAESAIVPDVEDGGTFRTFDAGGSGAGRDLLLPTRSHGAAASWRFRSVAEGRATRLVFGEATGGPGRAGTDRSGTVRSGTVRPDVLYRREGSTPFRLTAEIDGQVVVDEEWAGPQGELRLPAIRSGSRTLRLRGDGATRFFVNRVAVESGDALARRFAERLPRTPFDILVEKRGSTLVTGRLYFEPGRSPRCSVRTSLPGLSRTTGTVSPEWTYADRSYEIAPSPGGRVPLLGSDRLWVDGSEPFFVRIGADVPDGRVRVRFVAQCSENIYFTLSQRVPGSAEERRLVLQTEAREVW